jgi:hypothetical protein
MVDQPLNQRLRELEEARLAPVEAPEPSLPHRPLLGELLIEKGLLAATELDSALERQRVSGRPLGQILVEMGTVSPQNLARTLTEQHGFDFSASLRARLGTAEGHDPADQTQPDSYFVRETTGDAPLHVAATFLDAADAAFEMIEERDPDALEIVRSRGGELEHLWSYKRAGAPASL